MQEDTFPAAEKILSDIDNVLRKDLNLVSFEIIPALDNENKSPVFHAENSLGLASWSVKPLYCYAYNRLLDLRRNKHRREDPSVVSRWLMGALLLNPDISTFWNMRRELIKSGRLDPTDELRFVAIVLYYKAKCFEAFAYRRWLLQYMLVEQKQPPTDVETLLRNEIHVASMSADRYANNCHAWSHREHVVGNFEALVPAAYMSLLKEEWTSSEKWCTKHISDYSGLAYRQFLLKSLLLSENSVTASDNIVGRREILYEFVKPSIRESTEVSILRDGSSNEALDLLHGFDTGNRSDIDYDRCLINLSYLTEECMFNDDLTRSYPDHEALWYQRRFLAHTIVVLTASYEKYSSYKIELFDPRLKIRQDKIVNETGNRSSVSRLEVAFQDRSKEIIKIAKSCGHHQSTMAEKFQKFLTTINVQL
ncbi:protein prenyltransferase alpha subunit repeat-containing protein 1 [Cephus cinctus]|uniref:Protein prenyltransferase alpha subunit repeat-containing protein 1 n=1 Tax=Cephus cinctus TaxID=211228 RepID=A0AAJ7RQQ6_CEPCN|nr:protein prenyltransferase alpha subunit repeat-containing protein 1 [Cephus cinctus]XP_024945355.1 protein prenyltransferase alpha subunit repeat-containing protein 1 [Cephus cinctus]XP_024945356.1 protein prenyltransferase alpha subunit repeat-containing protein 1 [Cephus cinctus]